MTLVLTQAQFEALRREAERKGRTVQQIVAAAVEEYLARHDHEGDDDEVERLAMEGARRWRPLLDRLAQ